MRIVAQSEKTLSLEFEDHLDQHQWLKMKEWENGEGWDIEFKEKYLELSHAELEVLAAAKAIKAY